MISDIGPYLESRQSAMLAMLEEMVLIQSGSANKAGVDAMTRLVERTCRTLPVRIQTIEQETLGNHLVVHTHAVDAASRRILLVGHMDTVFPADTDFNWFREDERHCYGPGVCDMKGGLVVGIFAMRALAECGLLAQIPLTFVFNADEEIGSPGSGGLIRDQARQSAAAFVLECAGKNGEIVTGRKGNLSLRLEVKGRAGHAAFAGRDKASAILALAHKTILLEQLNDHENGLTVNVGQVLGGIGANTVAENARAWVDCRFVTPQQKQALEARLHDMVSTNAVPGTRSTLAIVNSRPPMPPSKGNRCLYEIVRSVGAKLGQSIAAEYRSGVSDANLIAAEGVPVVDGLGPAGGKDHSDEEYMLKESLIQRTLLLSNTVVAVRRHFRL
jgi:glutamate carboxypeptidase